MNFNSKETYLAARAQWTKDYNELSAQIRAARVAYRNAQRAYALDPKSYYSGAHLEVINTLRAYDGLKADASASLATLSAGKVEAARQWEAEHLQPA